MQRFKREKARVSALRILAPDQYYRRIKCYPAGDKVNKFQYKSGDTLRGFSLFRANVFLCLEHASQCKYPQQRAYFLRGAISFRNMSKRFEGGLANI